MTQVFCLNDSLYNEDGLYISDDQWLVYWYEDGGYDGLGEAVKLDKNGKLFRKDLGHCSCNDPTDDWDNPWEEISADSFRKINNVASVPCNHLEVENKVRELLGITDPPEVEEQVEKSNDTSNKIPKTKLWGEYTFSAMEFEALILQTLVNQNRISEEQRNEYTRDVKTGKFWTQKSLTKDGVFTIKIVKEI